MNKFVLPTKQQQNLGEEEKTPAEFEKTRLKKTKQNFGVLIPKAKNTSDQKWD